KRDVKEGRKNAWDVFLRPIQKEQQDLIGILKNVASKSSQGSLISKIKDSLVTINEPTRKDLLSAARKALRLTIRENHAEKQQLSTWINNYFEFVQPKFSSHLYCETNKSALNVPEIKPTYNNESDQVDARIIIRDNFDALLKKYPEILIFGEDTGNIGDVNQGLEGLQIKYGEHRVTDTGIREATIIGQGIGMALRGLRPIAEIQYLDYVLYALQI